MMKSEKPFLIKVHNQPETLAGNKQEDFLLKSNRVSKSNQQKMLSK